MPLYRAIVEALRDEIKEGRYQKTFPSEAQLVRRFAVGRQTVIRAMGELVNQGLVERRRGSGTVVSRRIRQTLGTIGLVLPNLESSPFTAERLIWRIRNPGEPPVTIQTHGELIIREST